MNVYIVKKQIDISHWVEKFSIVQTRIYEEIKEGMERILSVNVIFHA